jgi:hypothetical protein
MGFIDDRNWELNENKKRTARKHTNNWKNFIDSFFCFFFHVWSGELFTRILIVNRLANRKGTKCEP